jgi:hypothetical protein
MQEIKLLFRLSYESQTMTKEYLHTLYKVRRDNKKMSSVEELAQI